MDYRVLLPVPERQWREPSRAQPKDNLGNQNRTLFVLTARLDDGHVRWRGRFDSREDADAFLYAVARLITLEEPIPVSLWRLPTPFWDPDIEPWVKYDFTSPTYLTTPQGSLGSWLSPADWNNSNNYVQILAAGGSGGLLGGNFDRPNATGGGGGEYRVYQNYNIANPGADSVLYQVSAATNGQVGNNGTAANGVSAGQTWWGGASFGGSAMGAGGGAGGIVSSTSGAVAGGAGGTGGFGGVYGTPGGAGGAVTGNPNPGPGYEFATGGGGAGGPYGGGSAGEAIGGGIFGTYGTDGGGSDAGHGGGGGAGGHQNFTSGNVGGSGIEWDGFSVGSGGGGGGSVAGAGSTAGGGGVWGGGGGGKVASSPSVSYSGYGQQGLIRITYTPILNSGLLMIFN